VGIFKVFKSNRYTVESDKTGAVRVTDAVTGRWVANRGPEADRLVRELKGKTPAAGDKTLRKLF
jgi:hypothetical protein